MLLLSNVKRKTLADEKEVTELQKHKETVDYLQMGVFHAGINKMKPNEHYVKSKCILKKATYKDGPKYGRSHIRKTHASKAIYKRAQKLLTKLVDKLKKRKIKAENTP